MKKKQKTEKKRCDWIQNQPSFYIDYHDNEWGVEVHSDKKLFEFIILEGAQAGLSWLTILKKREGYKKAYSNWDVSKVAKYNEAKIQKLILNPEIVRNKLKIRASVKNAQVFLKIQKEFGSFDKYIWSFIDFKQIKNHFKNIKELPTTTGKSDEISKDLKKRGMSFVGSRIIYAHMQATGMVNDHTKNCFKYEK